MPRWESSLIALSIGIAAPATASVACWWLAAAIAMYGPWPLSESAIAASAFVGLAVGTILDVLALKRWVRGFYTVGDRIVVLLYLVWSVIALALFMGAPVGVLLLGGCAGVYVGRKARHSVASEAALERSARIVALFTAGVIAVESAAMGLLALQERFTVTWVLSRLGLGALTGSPLARVSVVVAGCSLLILAQYALTSRAAMWAYRIGPGTSAAGALPPPDGAPRIPS